MSEEILSGEVSNNTCMMNCTMCRKYLPCVTTSKKTDDVICKDFESIIQEDAKELEDLQAINASIPEDDITLPDDYETLPVE